MLQACKLQCFQTGIDFWRAQCWTELNNGTWPTWAILAVVGSAACGFMSWVTTVPMKCQERPSWVLKMSPDLAGGAYSVPRPPTWWGTAPSPRTPSSALGPSGRAVPLSICWRRLWHCWKIGVESRAYKNCNLKIMKFGHQTADI